MANHFVRQALPTSFMTISIIGFLFSAFIVWPISIRWGFTLCLLFLVWFIAAVYNFTHAPGEKHLDIHGSDAYLRE